MREQVGHGRAVHAGLEFGGAALRDLVEVAKFFEGERRNGGDVIRPRDRGFIAAVLPPGTRAAAIAVDAVSGVAGLIWPGDRVDIILTQEFPPGSENARRIVTSETIITDVRIIVTNLGGRGAADRSLRRD